MFTENHNWTQCRDHRVISCNGYIYINFYIPHICGSGNIAEVRAEIFKGPKYHDVYCAVVSPPSNDCIKTMAISTDVLMWSPTLIERTIVNE